MKTGQFWSFVFPCAPNCGSCALVSMSGASESLPPGAGAVFVELFRDAADDTRFTMFVSVPSDRAPELLSCVFGFSNDPVECSELGALGLPVTEAQFVVERRNLIVNGAAYRRRGGPEDPSRLETVRRLIQIGNIDMDKPSGRAADFNPVYASRQSVPDLACPDTQVVQRTLHIRTPRSAVVSMPPAGAYLTFEPTLFPDLAALGGDAPVISTIYAGRFGTTAIDIVDKPSRAPRMSVFGPPSFVFEDLEIVGFRIDSTAVDELIKPLNFHEEDNDPSFPVDFRYKAATSTVIIEMLRYGKMRAPAALDPFKKDDFMSQHELLARIVVGRVDDDTSQARDAAVFVPAIFVDNPWSKAVGRLSQGFPKVLTQFCAAGGVVLDMDASDELYTVTEVRLARRAGENTTDKDAILCIECPDAIDGSEGSKDEFEGLPLTTLFNPTVSRRAPWEQFDFDEKEFRRAFAQTLIGYRFGKIRTVQVCPVDGLDPAINAPEMSQSWITGGFTLSDVRVAFPTGVATLTFKRPPHAPEAWRKLCEGLSDKSGRISFPTGDWYRVRCSMELKFDDGLQW